MDRDCQFQTTTIPLNDSITENPWDSFGGKAVIASIGKVIFTSLCLAIVVSPLQAQTLNQQVVAMEERREQEFEDFFQRDFTSVTQDATGIAQTLARLGKETQTTPAVLWVTPRETNLRLVLITPNGEPIVRELYNVPQKRLLKTIQEFVADINNPNRPPNLIAAQQLHQWLLGPYEAEFLQKNNIDMILFCLGAGIRALPLAALHDGEKYLVEKYTLTQIPAFNLIDTQYRNNQSASILAMGASQFANQPPLLAVPVELQTILNVSESGALPPNPQNELLLLNETFTPENLQSILADRPFDIVHIATHAAFRQGTPQASYIEFFNETLSFEQFAQLPWQPLRTELLVLSACQTALGDRQAELGFAGLALQAGVKSAIASVWEVSDAGTLALMAEFYQQLAAVNTKAQALQQAQIKMLNREIRFINNELQLSDSRIPIASELNAVVGQDSDLSHPYYWSGFNFISSPW